MKRTEIILVILLFIGLTFKVFFIPLAGTILTLSIMSLAIMYEFLSFAFFNGIRLKTLLIKDSYKETTVLRIIGSVVTGVGLSCVLIGILFKIQNWPLANNTLSAGLFFLTPVLIIAAFKLIRTRAPFYARILLRASITTAAGILFLILSTTDLVKIKFRNHPDYIKAYEQYIVNPQNDSLRKNLDLEFNKMFMDEETFNEYKIKTDNKK
jgi:hypothetical protein